MKSRPVWGAWIEMSVIVSAVDWLTSRAPYGARGLKSDAVNITPDTELVAPRMGRVD